MKKHHCNKRQIVGRTSGPTIGPEILRRDQCVAAKKFLELPWREIDLIKEHCTVRRNQQPSDDWRIARRHRVLDWKHVADAAFRAGLTGGSGVWWMLSRAGMILGPLRRRCGRLLARRRSAVGCGEEFTERAPQAMNLVEQIEDDGYSLIVDPQVLLEIPDELRSGNVDF